jgi:hypothetical protein
MGPDNIIITNTIWRRLPEPFRKALRQTLGKKSAVLNHRACDVASALFNRGANDLALSLYSSLSAEHIPGNGDTKASVDRPKGQWERLKDIWVEVILAGVLVGACLLFMGLWVGEWRAHDDTKGKLEREASAKQTVTAQHDELKSQLCRRTSARRSLSRTPSTNNFAAAWLSSCWIYAIIRL